MTRLVLLILGFLLLAWCAGLASTTATTDSNHDIRPSPSKGFDFPGVWSDQYTESGHLIISPSQKL